MKRMKEGGGGTSLCTKRLDCSLPLSKTGWDQGMHGSETIAGELLERILGRILDLCKDQPIERSMYSNYSPNTP